MDSRFKVTRRGFTLIELLIVIAIIALLAAILFPVFARVRENARKAACQSNLKQLALGFQQYVADYDNRFPHAWDTNPQVPNNPPYIVATVGSDDPVIWPAKIFPYVKDKGIYNCPSVTKALTSCTVAPFYSGTTLGWKSTDTVIASAAPLANNGYTGASQTPYGYNVYYLGGGQFMGRLSCQHVVRPSAADCYTCGTGALESQLQQPSTMALLIDNNYQNRGAGTTPAFFDILMGWDGGGDLWCETDGTTYEPYDTVDLRHNGGVNVAFVDGHVKWLKKETATYKPSGLGCNTMTSYAADSKFIWDRF